MTTVIRAHPTRYAVQRGARVDRARAPRGLRMAVVMSGCGGGYTGQFFDGTLLPQFSGSPFGTPPHDHVTNQAWTGGDTKQFAHPEGMIWTTWPVANFSGGLKPAIGILNNGLGNYGLSQDQMTICIRQWTWNLDGFARNGHIWNG